jgi:hypothetical protein
MERDEQGTYDPLSVRPLQRFRSLVIRDESSLGEDHDPEGVLRLESGCGETLEVVGEEELIFGPAAGEEDKVVELHALGDR